MIVKLLTEHDLEFLSLKGGCTGSSESKFVKMPHCWKSHAAAQILPDSNIQLMHSFEVNIRICLPDNSDVRGLTLYVLYFYIEDLT